MEIMVKGQPVKFWADYSSDGPPGHYRWIVGMTAAGGQSALGEAPTLAESIEDAAWELTSKI
jgi:hypothetical protein